MVTVVVVFRVSAAGESEEMVGAGAVTVKVTVLLVPSPFVTETAFAPVAALEEITKAAVTDVAVELVPVTVIPLETFTVDPVRFVPVKVIWTVLPCAPADGLMLANVGVRALTVKLTGLLVPPVVVTVTFAMLGVAFGAIVNVAVIRVPLALETLETVIPALSTPTLTGEAKFLPVSVTDTLAPCVPLVGLMLLRTGAGGVTVKTTAEEVPPAVVTVTFAGPVAAPEATANVAVIRVLLTTAILVMLTLLFAMLTVAPETKLAPVSVTGTLLP
jgi:hypothetical protein